MVAALVEFHINQKGMNYPTVRNRMNFDIWLADLTSLTDVPEYLRILVMAIQSVLSSPVKVRIA